MYYVYILKGISNGEIYIGYTDNLKRRLSQHNKGKSFSTKRYIPWQLIYCEVYKSENDAKTREFRLKYHGRALAQLKRRIKESLL
jgi:putative endonuclease